MHGRRWMLENAGGGNMQEKDEVKDAPCLVALGLPWHAFVVASVVVLPLH